MSESNLKPPLASSAQPIGPSRHQRSDSTFSQSPARASATARLATPVYGSPSGSQTTTEPPQDDDTRTPLAGATGSSLPGPGTSSLSQALRGARGQPSFGTPPKYSDAIRVVSPPPEARPRAGYGSLTPRSYNAQQYGRSPRGAEDIEVLKRHLVGTPQGGSEPSSYKRASGFSRNGEPSATAQDEEFSSLQLQGGDTTRHIYRYAEKREKERAEAQQREAGKVKRSRSMNLPKADVEDDHIQNIQMPGGFRREHIRRTGASPAPSSTYRRTGYGTIDRARAEPLRPAPRFVASNFIEFLTLYGHFAGEDLDEDDEVLEPDEYFGSETYDDADDEAERGHSDDDWREDSRLLTPGKRKRRRKAREASKGSPLGAALLLLKSFVGTGVLFLPRAFYNGGMLFSFAVLVFLACVSYYCFILLVGTRLKVNASYGDMGRLIYGKAFQSLINFSLVISQIGFACAYIIFVSENLQAFILAVSRCQTGVSVKWFILIQMLIFLPISLYRNINNIQKMALVADLFILLGLVYLYYYDIKTIVTRPGFADFQNFNPASWTLLIGTAIFTFEGVGLVIPIQSGMREPEKFPKVLASVILIIGVIFISMGALSYAAYGSNTQTVILLNMPQDDKLVNTVQFLYSLAILLSIPLQIFPAIEITSQQMFSKTGKYNPWIKWQKNCFRFFMVILCAGIAWAGADDLDKFVSLVGSFACIPLVYIYPPLMHYKVISTRAWQSVLDFVLVIFGFCMMTYTTALTIMSWINGQQDKTPGYCDRP